MRAITLPGVRSCGAARTVAREASGSWVTVALVAIAALATVLNTWSLSANGYGNSYYAAASLAASKSWSAAFFGSLDAGNFITVDKPPLATFVSGLSVRLFGLSPWSVLLPQAIAGVAAVVILFQTVRRSFGPVAAVIAGVVMALTPVAVLIFRQNQPDALLTLLLVAAAAVFWRGVETGRMRWAIAASVLLGFAFLTKYLQAYLVVPAFALVWIVEARASLRRRIAGLFAAGLALLVASGWWVVLVDLIPASARPYVGGSTTNSALELLLGYDGFQRIFGFLRGGRFGRPAGADGGFFGGPGGFGGGLPFGTAPGGFGFGGAPGVFRLFTPEFIGQVGWLIPVALFALVVGLVLHARAPRGGVRAAYLFWGTWLLGAAAVLSFMSGIIHSYYTVMLAPAIAALIGAAVVDLWRLRSRSILGSAGLAAMFFGSAWIGSRILALTPGFAPGLATAALLAAVAASAAMLLPAARSRRLAVAGVAVGMAAMLAGPAAYAAETVTTPTGGAMPSAGPSIQGFRRGGGGVFVRRANGVPQALTPPSGFAPRGPRGGGPGEASSEPSALTDFLVRNRGGATWVVAVRGAQQAASLELATREPVMAMGGFSGSDPAPTLDQLKAYVASGRLRYVLIGGRGGFGGFDGGRGDASAVDAWVQQNGTPVDLPGVSGTLYDLGAQRY